MDHIRNEIAAVLDAHGVERKAIRTLYNGVHYRSRLEARWSIFLDYIGVQHVYEFEGFELPSSRYLPDFWLPNMEAWLEIKPIEPSAIERQLCEELASVTRSRVYLANGLPRECDGLEVFALDGVSVWSDTAYSFCACPACGAIGVEFGGRGERVCGRLCFPDSDKGGVGERVRGGIQAAQLARFWDPR